MMVLDAEQKAKLKRGEKSKSPRRATAPEETGTGMGTGTDKGDGSRTMGDIIIRALSSSQAQAATAPPPSLRTLPPSIPVPVWFRPRLGPGSAAAASGAESTLAPEAVLAARQHLCALIPLFVNRTLELYAALGPIRRRFNPPRAPRVVHLRRAPARGGGDGGEAVGHASRRHLPQGVGGKSATPRAASTIRVHGALGDGASVPHALRRVFPPSARDAFPVAHAARAVDD